MHVICDLDGVIWLADDVIPGAPDGVARLRSAGHRVVFVSNNSFAPVATVEAKLQRMGIAAVGDVFTSAQAAASLVRPGERVQLHGGPGAAECLRAAGAHIVEEGPVDVVVVGYHRSFDYDGLRRGMQAIRAGARFIATNEDATYPTPEGPIPGCGSLVAAFAAASGVDPIVAGKPHEPMAAVVQRVLGSTPHDIMVGDRPDTDGLFASRLGCRFGLVMSGVTNVEDLPVYPTPNIITADFAAMVDQLLTAG